MEVHWSFANYTSYYLFFIITPRVNPTYDFIKLSRYSYITNLSHNSCIPILFLSVKKTVGLDERSKTSFGTLTYQPQKGAKRLLLSFRFAVFNRAKELSTRDKYTFRNIVRRQTTLLILARWE